MAIHKKIISQVPFLLCLVGIALVIAWFYAVTPRWHSLEIIHPDLHSTQNAPEPILHRDWHEEDQGLYWMRFTIEPQIFTVNKYRIRTYGCLNSITTNGQEWTMPENHCDVFTGIPIQNASRLFKEKTEWSLAGDTDGGSFGAFLNKDWSDPRLMVGLFLLCSFLTAALYMKLPVENKITRSSVTLLLLGALAIRFWSVFIKAPPEMYIFSDMRAYYGRAQDLLDHTYYLDQIFQPLGYTVWSLMIRLLGGWELYDWAQVFLSWGTVLIVFLMSLEYMGMAVALIATALATIHVPFLGFASFHMSECAYIFLMTLTLWMTVKTVSRESYLRYFMLGLLLMISFYFKASHSLFIPFLCLWILYRDRQHIFVAFKKIAVMGIACLLVTIPHLVFTAKVFNKPYLGPTAGGMNFVMGKCKWKGNVDVTGTGWYPPLFVQLGETDSKTWDVSFADQGVFYKEGLKCIEENPMVMLQSFRYIYYLFTGNGLWPIESSALYSVYNLWLPFFNFILLPFCLIGLIGRVRQQNDFDRTASLLMLSLFVMVYIFYSENRYRAPFDGILIIWSACGIVGLWQSSQVLFFAVLEHLLLKNPIPEEFEA